MPDRFAGWQEGRQAGRQAERYVEMRVARRRTGRCAGEGSTGVVRPAFRLPHLASRAPPSSLPASRGLAPDWCLLLSLFRHALATRPPCLPNPLCRGVVLMILSHDRSSTPSITPASAHIGDTRTRSTSTPIPPSGARKRARVRTRPGAGQRRGPGRADLPGTRLGPGRLQLPDVSRAGGAGS